MRGRCPRAPGIYRFPARMAAEAAASPPTHSGPWVGALVASLRCHILRPGADSITSSGQFEKFFIAARSARGL